LVEIKDAVRERTFAQIRSIACWEIFVFPRATGLHQKASTPLVIGARITATVRLKTHTLPAIRSWRGICSGKSSLVHKKKYEMPE